MNTIDTMSAEDKDYYFSLLDKLRESGQMNMFHAPAWLQENESLSKHAARDIFLAWANHFDHENERL